MSLFESNLIYAVIT